MEDVGELLNRLLAADRAYREVVKQARANGGAVVHRARRDLGMTQRAFADALGVHYTYISKIENGASVVSRALLGKIARLLAGEPVEDRRNHAPARP